MKKSLVTVCLVAVSSFAQPAFRGRFEGRPQATVQSVLVAFADLTPPSPGAIEVASGQRIVRTDLLVELEPTATIGQVQPRFDALKAKLVVTTPERLVMTLRLPDPGSLSRLEAIRQSLRKTPGIHRAEFVTLPPVSISDAVTQLKACVPTGQQLPPISVIIAIASSGAVANVDLVPTDSAKGELATCVRARAAQLAFEPREREDTLEFELVPRSRVFTTSTAPLPPRPPRQRFERSFTLTTEGATISVPGGETGGTADAELVFTLEPQNLAARERLAARDYTGALNELKRCAASESCLALRVVALMFRDGADDLNEALRTREQLFTRFPRSRARPALDRLVQIELR